METVLQKKREDFVYDRRLRNSGFDMTNAHYHTHYELLYLLSGQCRIFINHTLYNMEPGTVVMIKPTEIHRTTYRSKPELLSDRIAINFSKEYLKELTEACGEEDTKRLLSQNRILIPAARRGYMEELFLKIGFEHAQEDSYSKILKKHHLYELLILLNRLDEEEEKPENLGGKESTIEAVVQYIYHHFDQPITLLEVADMAHMSPTYFSRKFKKVTGFGYKEYLNNVRMKKAGKLLLTTDESVTQIALKCGFSDGNYFGDAFRKAKGMSPNQYRKNPDVY